MTARVPLIGLCACTLLWTGVRGSGSVALRGGDFAMGSTEGDADERPVHTVSLSPFAVDTREVTYAEYDSCVKKGGCTPAHYDDGKCLIWSPPSFKRVRVPVKYRSPDYPVVCVTWQQARQYCRYKGKRLPTEAEWEYAALGGANGRYSWGNDPPSSSNCTPRSHNRPRAVGSHPPNGWGLSDMTGNVWEWTNDRYQKDYYGEPTAKDPRGPDVGRYRVVRGGGWYSGPAQLRVRNRHWFAPECGEVSVGFRCAR